jgi:hypothetical protein
LEWLKYAQKTPLAGGVLYYLFMREIWDSPFGHAHLKIERANEHIAEIEKRIRIAAHSHSPHIHFDPKTGEKYLHCAHTDYKLAASLAVCVGDAIHNLHSALDIAWVEIVRKFGKKGPTKHTRFPIDPQGARQKLESTLTESAEIPRAHPACKLLLDGIKPYKGGDQDILLVNSLDIDDKHKLLIPLVTVAGVMGVELEHEDGRRIVTDIVLVRRESYRRIIPPDCELKNHGETTFLVTFGKVAGLDAEVVPTLQRFSRKVLKIVRLLQRMR